MCSCPRARARREDGDAPCTRRGEASPAAVVGFDLEGRGSHLRAAAPAARPPAASGSRRLSGTAGARSLRGQKTAERAESALAVSDEQESVLCRRWLRPAGLLAEDGGSLGKQ